MSVSHFPIVLQTTGHTCPIAWKPMHFVRPTGECIIFAAHRKLPQAPSLQTYGNALSSNVSSTFYNGTWVCLLMNARNAILQCNSLRFIRKCRLVGMYAQLLEAQSGNGKRPEVASFYQTATVNMHWRHRLGTDAHRGIK